jgi:hypothetical protein
MTADEKTTVAKTEKFSIVGESLLPRNQDLAVAALEKKNY